MPVTDPTTNKDITAWISSKLASALEGIADAHLTSLDYPWPEVWRIAKVLAIVAGKPNAALPAELHRLRDEGPGGLKEWLRRWELRDIGMVGSGVKPEVSRGTPATAVHMDGGFTKSQLAAMLASVDDTKHNIMWVDHDGVLHLDTIPDGLSPAGFASQQELVMRFRLETFGAGNGYAGPGAAASVTWVEELFDRLTQAWASGQRGYLD